MAKLIKKAERIQLDFWEQYYKDIQYEDKVSIAETPEEKTKRIQALEDNPEAWFKYYFHKYYTAEPMPFHTKSSKRILNNAEWYEVRPWSRELAKSGRAMMEFIYLALTGKKRFILLLSATNDSAVRLLKPFKLAFEKNQRIINDYGVQQTHGHWTESSFTIAKGAMFVAIGSGNAPRGARNEEYRPDAVLIDDYDTDEDCRNPDMVDKKWDFFEKAVYATRSISNPMLVLFNGNIIADYCCIKKAMEMADFYEIVNIRDENGKSTWPTKNTEEMIDRVLSKISEKAVQGEYFNNPVVLGKVFKEIHYSKVQPLNKYKYLVAYTDPSYKKNGDYKATYVIGKYKDEYHILFARCQQTTVAQMIQWQFDALNFVNDRSALYLYIEYPWIDSDLKREIKKANKKHDRTLNLKADERSKPDKFYRIESNLEPLNRQGKLIFADYLEGTVDMKNTAFQFLALSPKSRVNDDAPDAVEGGVWIINNKQLIELPPPRVFKAKQNQKRY